MYSSNFFILLAVDKKEKKINCEIINKKNIEKGSVYNYSTNLGIRKGLKLW